MQQLISWQLQHFWSQALAMPTAEYIEEINLKRE